MPEEEVEVEGLAPFTLEDAQEDEKACMLCEHYDTCPIIRFVNKLSQKRDGRTAEAEYSCVIFQDRSDEEEVQT